MSHDDVFPHIVASGTALLPSEYDWWYLPCFRARCLSWKVQSSFLFACLLFFPISVFIFLCVLRIALTNSFFIRVMFTLRAANDIRVSSCRVLHHISFVSLSELFLFCRLFSSVYFSLFFLEYLPIKNKTVSMRRDWWFDLQCKYIIWA